MAINAQLIKGESILQKAWDGIMPSQFQMCVDVARERGGGIHDFYILSQVEIDEFAKQHPDDDKPSNCIYMFFRKDTHGWTSVIDDAPYKDSLLSKYDPDSHVIISIRATTVDGERTKGKVWLIKNYLEDGKIVEVDV